MASGSLECVRLLLEFGASADVCDRTGATPLILSVQALNADCVRCLLEEAGADVNAAAKDGRTALLYSAEEDSSLLVALLCEAGADLNALTEDGESAVVLAVQSGSFHALEALIAAGADVNRAAPILPIDLAREDRTSDNARMKMVEMLQAARSLTPSSTAQREKTKRAALELQKQRATEHERNAAVVRQQQRATFASSSSGADGSSSPAAEAPAERNTAVWEKTRVRDRVAAFEPPSGNARKKKGSVFPFWGKQPSKGGTYIV